MNLMKYRKLWYAFSLLVVISGIFALSLWGLKPSIDFTGGTLVEIAGTKDEAAVLDAANKSKFEGLVLISTEKGFTIRSKPVTEEMQKSFSENLTQVKGAKQIRFEMVGPLISKEITRRAFIAVFLAALIIIFFVAYSFRKVPYPANSWEFGVVAIIALLHDTIAVLGVFAFLGHFLNVEVDPLFITGLLTVIGFSVHDTIVIFDRIRENLIKKGADDFEGVANLSVVEMLPRTIVTSLLVWIILLILFLFGGVTIKYFILTLVVGIFFGTYSSIFMASPLLITWREWRGRG